MLAGRAEGLALLDLLELEEIDALRWAEAAAAWAKCLAGELRAIGADRALFDDHLTDAQARYGRSLHPLDDDLGAWLDFQRGRGASRVEVRPHELARLVRLWSRRLARDPAIVREARRLERADRPVRLVGPRSRFMAAVRVPRRVPDAAAPLVERMIVVPRTIVVNEIEGEPGADDIAAAGEEDIPWVNQSPDFW